MALPNYVHLGGAFYFDAKNRFIMKKTGERYVFVRHDRRSSLGQKPVAKDRRSQAQADAGHFKPIAGGLFWSPEEKAVFKKTEANYVLYSRDRRKTPGENAGGPERREP